MIPARRPVAADAMALIYRGWEFFGMLHQCPACKQYRGWLGVCVCGFMPDAKSLIPESLGGPR